MQQMTYEIGRGAEIKSEQFVLTVRTSSGEIEGTFFALQNGGALVRRRSDGRMCNNPIPYAALLVTDEDAERLTATYTEYRAERQRAHAAAEAFAQSRRRRSYGAKSWGRGYGVPR